MISSVASQQLRLVNSEVFLFMLCTFPSLVGSFFCYYLVGVREEEREGDFVSFGKFTYDFWAFQ